MLDSLSLMLALFMLTHRWRVFHSSRGLTLSPSPLLDHFSSSSPIFKTPLSSSSLKVSTLSMLLPSSIICSIVAKTLRIFSVLLSFASCKHFDF